MGSIDLVTDKIERQIRKNKNKNWIARTETKAYTIIYRCFSWKIQMLLSCLKTYWFKKPMDLEEALQMD